VDFTVAAYNAHWGVGRFGAQRGVRFDVAHVIRGFDADIVVVPEAWRADDGPSVVDPLADEYHIETVELMPLAMRKDRRSDLVPRQGWWELAVCSRFAILEHSTIPIGVIPTDPAGPRNALAVVLDVAGTRVQLIAIHTSSKVWKLASARHLLTLRRALQASPWSGPQIIAGDFNFWGPPVAMILPGWKRPVRGRTYTSRRPHSQIDHILVRGGIEPLSGEVLAPTPSDHLPIRARLRLSDQVT